MKRLSLLAACLWLALGCGHTCPPPKDPGPAEAITVRVGCLGDPRLPARPTIDISALTSAFYACGDVVCSSAQTVNTLAEYLESVAYYHAQLDALCPKELDDDDQDEAVDGGVADAALVPDADAAGGLR